MRVAEKRIAFGLAGALLLTLAGAAGAQQPAPKPAPPKPAPAQHPAPAPVPQAQAAPADQNPQRTTASYGDWVVRCEVAPGPPPQKNCDMEQLAQVQGQANPISRVAIPLPPKGEPAKLFIQLPINVSFTAPVKIVTDGKDAGITTPFRRCVPAGCFAEIELKDDIQKKFRASAEPGKIMFKDAADRDVAIPLSFKGYAQAFEALLKQ
jgi:invasion protein IalB